MRRLVLKASSSHSFLYPASSMIKGWVENMNSCVLKSSELAIVVVASGDRCFAITSSICLRYGSLLYRSVLQCSRKWLASSYGKRKAPFRLQSSDFRLLRLIRVTIVSNSNISCPHSVLRKQRVAKLLFCPAFRIFLRCPTEIADWRLLSTG